MLIFKDVTREDTGFLAQLDVLKESTNNWVQVVLLIRVMFKMFNDTGQCRRHWSTGGDLGRAPRAWCYKLMDPGDLRILKKKLGVVGGPPQSLGQLLPTQ